MKDQEKDTGGVPPLLELRQVSRTFTVRDHAFGETRKLRAVSDVDLRLNRGDCLGLVGESGCGKSTLGRLACGLIPPTSGQILYRGTPLPPAGPHSSVAGRLQMVFQDPYSSLNPRLRVGRSVSEGLLAACFSREHPEYTREAVRDRTAEMFRLVGLAGMENRYPHEFSGGQRQRIVRSSPIPISWSATNLFPHWTRPFRLRCSTPCATCMTALGRVFSSSPITWP